jgi:TetR/AcrR family transcriptional regulator
MEDQVDVQGRRGAILEAATELFARRGFGGVAIQEIADQAGVHKTTVLYQFGTKEALHEAVLDHALQPVITAMNDFLEGDFTRERLSWHLDQLHRQAAENPSVPRLLIRELLEGDEYGDAYMERFVEPVYAPAKRRLEEAQRQASGRIADIDPAQFVHDLHVQIMSYFCHGPLLERLMGRDPYSVDALIARRNHLVNQILAQQRPVRDDEIAEIEEAVTTA